MARNDTVPTADFPWRGGFLALARAGPRINQVARLL
jgi:hypothetical protein